MVLLSPMAFGQVEALFPKGWKTSRLDPIKSFFNAIILVDGTDLRLNGRRFSKTSEKTVRGHGDKSVRSLLYQDILLLKYPVSRIQREHRVPYPRQLAFSCLVHG